MAETSLAGVETAGARNLQEPLTGHFDKLMLGKGNLSEGLSLGGETCTFSKSSTPPTPKKSPTKFSWWKEEKNPLVFQAGEGEK